MRQLSTLCFNFQSSMIVGRIYISSENQIVLPKGMQLQSKESIGLDVSFLFTTTQAEKEREKKKKAAAPGVPKHSALPFFQVRPLPTEI